MNSQGREARHEAAARSTGNSGVSDEGISDLRFQGWGSPAKSRAVLRLRATAMRAIRPIGRGGVTVSVLPFDASTHAAVDALLPFYVNATLRGEELALVERHVRACEKCQREIVWLHDLFDACATLPMFQGTSGDESGAFQDARIPDRQGSRWRGMKTGWQSTPSWTRWLIAAQLGAIILLGTVVAGSGRDDPSFRTLGTSAPSAQIHDAVAVMFDSATTEAEIRRIVVGVGARIVDGPTSTDVFVLEMPASRTEQALRTLRFEHAVRLAESLGPRTGR